MQKGRMPQNLNNFNPMAPIAPSPNSRDEKFQWASNESPSFLIMMKSAAESQICSIYCTSWLNIKSFAPLNLCSAIDLKLPVKVAAWLWGDHKQILPHIFEGVKFANSYDQSSIFLVYVQWRGKQSILGFPAYTLEVHWFWNWNWDFVSSEDSANILVAS